MILQLDNAILNWIHTALRCDLLDWAMPYITALGNKGLLWILLGLILLLIKKHRKTAVTLAFSLLLCLFIGNMVLKPLVARIRPFEANGIETLLIEQPTDFSFPSGHTMSSFAAAGVLMTADKKLGIPALALAALIAFSRLYLYVHYPSDVLAGMALGIAISFFAQKICQSKFTKKNS